MRIGKIIPKFANFLAKFWLPELERNALILLILQFGKS